MPNSFFICCKKQGSLGSSAGRGPPPPPAGGRPAPAIPNRPGGGKAIQIGINT